MIDPHALPGESMSAKETIATVVWVTMCRSEGCWARSADSCVELSVRELKQLTRGQLCLHVFCSLFGLKL